MVCPPEDAVTHPGSNRARRALTSFMRRTPLTTTRRRRQLGGLGSAVSSLPSGVRGGNETVQTCGGGRTVRDGDWRRLRELSRDDDDRVLTNSAAVAAQRNRRSPTVTHTHTHTHTHTLTPLVTTGMGDRLRAGIPSRCVTSQLGQLSLASLRGR